MATDARSTSRDRLRAMPCQKEENERSEVKSTKTIRMSLSRERHLAVLKRAPDAGLQANRPRFLTLRLHVVLLPLQAIMRKLHLLHVAAGRERFRPDAGAVKRSPG